MSIIVKILVATRSDMFELKTKSMANSIQNPEYKILSTLLHRSDEEYNRILHNGHFKDRQKLVTVVEVTVI